MNLFDLPPLLPDEELIEVLVQNKKIRIERIVSGGQTTGWYDQDETEFVILLQGDSSIEYAGGRVVSLKTGDTLLLPSHTRHRVCYTSKEPPCVWLCVFWKD